MVQVSGMRGGRMSWPSVMGSSRSLIAFTAPSFAPVPPKLCSLADGVDALVLLLDISKVQAGNDPVRILIGINILH
jgi:hypothetical protein